MGRPRKNREQAQEVEINVTPTAPQLEFFEMDRMYRLFLSGIGAGKTFGGAVEIARMPPNTTGAVISPTYPMHRDMVLPTFFDTCGKLVLDYNKSDKEAYLIDGKKVIFRTAEDPERLRGPNLSWFWLDEAALMDEMVWKIMIGRLRVLPMKAWVTTTPKGKMHWLYKIFVKEANEFTGIVKCSTRSNVYLPEQFIRSLDTGYKGLWHLQEVEGEFVDFGATRAYPMFSRLRNVRKNIFQDHYNPRAPLHVACDFNYAIMSWPCIQVHPLLTQIPLESVSDSDALYSQPYVLTEVELIPANTPAMCREFRKRFPNHTGPVVFYGDASGSSGDSHGAGGYSHYDIIDKELREHYDLAFMIPRKNPPVVNRLVVTNDVFSGTGYWRPVLVDEDECPTFINDGENVLLTENGDNIEKITKQDDERSLLTHSTDGFGYWASIEVPVKSMEVAQELNDIRDMIRYGRNMENDPRPHGAGLMGV
jgi:hypothetical protein